MVRSIFFAAGLFILVWGAVFLKVDEIVLDWKYDPNPEPTLASLFVSINDENKHVVHPPDWAAFSMMSIGTITMMYALALPQRYMARSQGGRGHGHGGHMHH